MSARVAHCRMTLETMVVTFVDAQDVERRARCVVATRKKTDGALARATDALDCRVARFARASRGLNSAPPPPRRWTDAKPPRAIVARASTRSSRRARTSSWISVVIASSPRRA